MYYNKYAAIDEEDFGQVIIMQEGLWTSVGLFMVRACQGASPRTSPARLLFRPVGRSDPPNRTPIHSPTCPLAPQITWIFTFTLLHGES